MRSKVGEIDAQHLRDRIGVELLLQTALSEVVERTQPGQRLRPRVCAQQREAAFQPFRSLHLQRVVPRIASRSSSAQIAIKLWHWPQRVCESDGGGIGRK